MILYGQRY
ncbi:MAG: hypothetical protein EZS28_036014, partial [Streblomastix strix]